MHQKRLYVHWQSICMHHIKSQSLCSATALASLQCLCVESKMGLELSHLSKACSLQNLIPHRKTLMISKNHPPQSAQICTIFCFVHLQVPKQTLVPLHPFFTHPLSQLMDKKDPKHIPSHPSPLLCWHPSPTLPLLNIYHSFSARFSLSQLD